MKKSVWFGLLLLCLSIDSPQVQAKLVFQNEYLIESDKANAFILDSRDDVSGDVSLQFGNTLAETIHFDIANDWFEVSDGMTIFGSTIVEHNDLGQSFRVNDETNDTSPFLIDQDGNVGIQNGAPNVPLDIEATGDVIQIGDGTATNSSITFDDGADRSLLWNAGALRFDLSESLRINGDLEMGGNIDLGSNQALNFRIENLGAEPTCNAGLAGRLYHNTSDDNSYVCDGTNYQIINNQTVSTTHYHNGAEINNVVTATRTDVSTTGEDTVIYLTDDGTNLGNKLFTEVYHVTAAAKQIESLGAAPAMYGYEYSAATGALTIKFLESNTVVLGGQGLEDEEAGTDFTVFVVGI